MKVNLFVGGKRSAVDADEAKEIVKRFQRELNNGEHEAYKVNMSCRQWKKEAIDIIEPFLASISTTIKFVDIADIIAGLMTDEGLNVTQRLADVFKNSDLTEVDLCDNAMGPRGLLRVESLFTNSNLKCLYLSNCGLSKESMGMLKGFVSGENKIASTLTELVLDKNMIGVEGAKIVGEILSECTNLQYISYKGCRPESIGTKYLCQGLLQLVENTKDQPVMLRRIDLEDCTFGQGDDEDDAIISFSKALEQCIRLQELNMKDGELEVGGVQMLVNALETAKSQLTHLYLDGQGEIGSDGAIILAGFLHGQVSSLRSLHMDYNELGDEGVSILLEPFARSRNVLESLSLNCNEIEEQGANAIIRAELPHLRALSLEENEEMPQKYIKAKFGTCSLKLDDDEEEEENENMDDMDALVKQFEGAQLK